MRFGRCQSVSPAGILFYSVEPRQINFVRRTPWLKGCRSRLAPVRRWQSGRTCHGNLDRIRGSSQVDRGLKLNHAQRRHRSTARRPGRFQRLARRGEEAEYSVKKLKAFRVMSSAAPGATVKSWRATDGFQPATPPRQRV